MSIVALSQYLEDVYRARLSAACRVSLQLLQHDALGELSVIVSLFCIAMAAPSKSSHRNVLPSFSAAEIVLDYDALLDIIESVKLAVTVLVARN